MDATAIYLDGNNFGNMASHQFIGKKKLEALYLNGSNINSLHNGTFNGLSGLKVLNLESNNLVELRGPEIAQLTNLRTVNLDNNRMARLGEQTFTKMKFLEGLSLSGNQISGFDLWQQLGGAFASGSLNRLSFDDSVRLNCDCDALLKFRDWQKFLASSELVNINSFLCRGSGRVTLGDSMQQCLASAGVVNNKGNSVDGLTNGKNVVFMSETTPNVQRTVLYSDNKPGHNLIGAAGYVPLISAIVAAIIGCALLMTLVCVFRQDVRVWAHSKYGVRLFRDPEARAAQVDQCSGTKDKLYDAYFVYNIRDSEFAQQIVAGELQHNGGYSLFLQHRDVHGGAGFLDVVHSVADISRKIVIVASLNFVHNEWQQPQFRMALQTLLESVPSQQRRYKFLVILTAPPELIVVDHLMQILLRTCSVICWGERRFWAKLKYLLPDVPRQSSSGQGNRQLIVHQNGLHNTLPHHHHAMHHHHPMMNNHHHQLHQQQHQQQNLQNPNQQLGLSGDGCCGLPTTGKMVKGCCSSNSPVSGGVPGMIMQGSSNNTLGRNVNMRYTPAPTTTTLDSWCKMTQPGGGVIVPMLEPTSTLDSRRGPQVPGSPFHGGGRSGQMMMMMNNNQSNARHKISPSTGSVISNNNNSDAEDGRGADDEETDGDDRSTGSSQHYEAPPLMYIPTTASSLGHVYSTIPETTTSSGKQSPLIGITTNPVNGLMGNLEGVGGVGVGGGGNGMNNLNLSSKMVSDNGRAYFV